MKTICQPASSFRAPLRRLGAGAPPAGLTKGAALPLLPRQRRNVSAASSLDQIASALSAVAPELQTLAQEVVARAESVDNAAAQFVLHQPLLSIPIAAVFVALSPKLIQVTSKRVGGPLVAAMLGWLVLTHPTALVHVLTELEAAVETQPVACSMAIFSLAVLLIAPYVTMGAGTAAGAWLVALVVQQEGWTPEQWAPAAVPLRTIQTKWDTAAQEAQLRGVTAPPSIPAPDLSTIVAPNIKLPDLPSISVPELPTLPTPPVPSWALNAIPNVPELSSIRAVNLDLTALKETLPTLSLPVTMQDMPWAVQGFALPWDKGFTLPWDAKPQAPSSAPAVAAKPAPAPALVTEVTSLPVAPAPAPEAPVQSAVPEIQVVSLPEPAAPAAPESAPEASAPVEVAALSVPEPSTPEAPAEAALSYVEAVAAAATELLSSAVEAPADSPLPVVVEVVAVLDSPSSAVEVTTEAPVGVVSVSDAPAAAAEAPTEPEISTVFVADE